MNIILSRKGTDSGSGGIPSPLLPDGTLLSLPIPASPTGDECTDLMYEQISYPSCVYGNINYRDLFSDLNTSYHSKTKHLSQPTYCHLDPDIRPLDVANHDSSWRPAFGQAGDPQTCLENDGVGVGDLFIFFGLYRRVDWSGHNFTYAARRNGGQDLHIAYGYLQVGEIITDVREMRERFPWHPHSATGRKNSTSKNALYLPATHLSLPACPASEKLPGYGLFRLDMDQSDIFANELVLSKQGASRSRWRIRDWMREGPDIIISGIKEHAFDFESDLLQTPKRGQEFVFRGTDALQRWALDLVQNYAE